MSVSLDVTPLEASDSGRSEGLDTGIGWGCVRYDYIISNRLLWMVKGWLHGMPMVTARCKATLLPISILTFVLIVTSAAALRQQAGLPSHGVLVVAIRRKLPSRFVAWHREIIHGAITQCHTHSTTLTTTILRFAIGCVGRGRNSMVG